MIGGRREDADGGKPRAESPPAKARKTGREEGAASISVGVPTERLKGEGMGDGDPLPEVEGVPNETLFVGNLSYRWDLVKTNVVPPILVPSLESKSERFESSTCESNSESWRVR